MLLVVIDILVFITSKTHRKLISILSKDEEEADIVGEVDSKGNRL
jgi:hypothetical protein